MSQFMLLLYDDPSQWEKLSPDEMQKALEKYMAWFNQPFVNGGKRLAQDAGRILRSEGGQPRATDGPYSETKEILGGFYIIEAADYDQAVHLAMTHPHLDYGTIEVRSVCGM